MQVHSPIRLAGRRSAFAQGDITRVRIAVAPKTAQQRGGFAQDDRFFSFLRSCTDVLSICRYELEEMQKPGLEKSRAGLFR
jgi:hypothetical protein